MHSRKLLNRCLPICLVTISFFLPIQAVLNYGDEAILTSKLGGFRFGLEADRVDWSNHPCNRKCMKNDVRVCKYVFVVEQYTTMGKACYDCPSNREDCYRPHCIPADGVEKSVYSINRGIPGPFIEACQHDIIVVDVRNAMLSESTVIHWHGIKHVATPYMDGVPYITQCPIQPGETFQYRFHATDDGTFFYHSHIGGQRADGLFGTLVVHSIPSENVHRHLYDHDIHRMIVIDWSHINGNNGLIKRFHAGTAGGVDTILVNGRGRFELVKKDNKQPRFTPVAVYEVHRGQRYRFRLINTGVESCPMEVSIDNHKLLAISMDSNDIEPTEVDIITVSAGERVDFVVNAKEESDNYWIRFKGYSLCKKNATAGAHQVAILHYSDAPDEDPRSPVGYRYPIRTPTTRVLNPYDAGTESDQRYNISVPSLNSVIDYNLHALTRVPDERIYISFDFYPLDNYDFHRKHLYGHDQVTPSKRSGSLQFNHISFKFPSVPLLTQYSQIRPDEICNTTTKSRDYCTREQCACTHVINVGLGSVVEIVLVDEGKSVPFNHPIHLHGNFFHVVASENLNGEVSIDRIKELDRQGRIHRKLHRAPLKDTMKVPSGGYNIIRAYMNNPGYWLFHCHFEEHLNTGMGLVFKVGEHRDFVPIPDNFPTCGNFKRRRTLKDIIITTKTRHHTKPAFAPLF